MRTALAVLRRSTINECHVVYLKLICKSISLPLTDKELSPLNSLSNAIISNVPYYP